MGWVGSSHPLNVVRSERLRQELGRWEEERARERRRGGWDEGGRVEEVVEVGNVEAPREPREAEEEREEPKGTQEERQGRLQESSQNDAKEIAPGVA